MHLVGGRLLFSVLVGDDWLSRGRCPSSSAGGESLGTDSRCVIGQQHRIGRPRNNVHTKRGRCKLRPGRRDNSWRGKKLGKPVMTVGFWGTNKALESIPSHSHDPTCKVCPAQSSLSDIESSPPRLLLGCDFDGLPTHCFLSFLQSLPASSPTSIYLG